MQLLVTIVTQDWNQPVAAVGRSGLFTSTVRYKPHTPPVALPPGDASITWFMLY